MGQTRFGERKHWLGVAIVALAASTAVGAQTSVGRGARDPLKATVIVGSEGHGLSERWQRSADRRAIIPMQAGIDSLNVAAASAVACYVAARRDS